MKIEKSAICSTLNCSHINKTNALKLWLFAILFSALKKQKKLNWRRLTNRATCPQHTRWKSESTKPRGESLAPPGARGGCEWVGGRHGKVPRSLRGCDECTHAALTPPFTWRGGSERLVGRRRRQRRVLIGGRAECRQERQTTTPAGEPEWVSERAFRFASVSGSTAGTRAADCRSWIKYSAAFGAFCACCRVKMAGLSFKDWNSRMDLFAAQQDVTDDEDDEDSVWTPAYGFPYSSEDNLFLASAELSGECSLEFGVTALWFTVAPPSPSVADNKGLGRFFCIVYFQSWKCRRQKCKRESTENQYI